MSQHANSAPEKSQLHLGFVALADAAPLVMAREAGFFASEGLDVALVRQASWAAIRDNVAIGRLDAAQMLAGLPLAATLGLGSKSAPMLTALSLGANGNSICLGEALWSRLVDEADMATHGSVSSEALARLIAADRAAGLAPMTLAMVHPVSSQHYQLRYWLAASGIDPDRDVRLIVVPPARMLANLRAGRIAGFCVGAPWSEIAVAEGLGRIAITGHELWANTPEKVLGVARDWAEAYPETHRALLRALLKTCHWLDTPGKRARAALTLAAPDHVDCASAVLHDLYHGRIRRHAAGPLETHDEHLVFAAHHANFPWRSHALWLVRQMQAAGQLHAATDAHALAEAVYRPALYREICQGLGLAAPAIDYKTEGHHSAAWQHADLGADITLGADGFFDGCRFDTPCRAGRGAGIPF